jgi:hypothetical protein
MDLHNIIPQKTKIPSRVFLPQALFHYQQSKVRITRPPSKIPPLPKKHAEYKKSGAAIAPLMLFEK